jgi:hypothetical protein
MDLLQHARQLFATGRMHDALEAAQAACDRAPKDAQAWWLLARIGRHTDMPVASDRAFQRAAQLDAGITLPHRVSPERFQALIDEAVATLGPDSRRRLEQTAIRFQAIPAADQVRGGVDPDALTMRERTAHDLLVLFQVNHENGSATEDALRALVSRSLSRA